MPFLFSYGTLQQANVQQTTFGRLLVGEKDILPCYQVGEVLIQDEHVLHTSGKAYHPILMYKGDANDQVIGTVFEISDKELLQADSYEVDAYVRRSATVLSGKTVWIYADAREEMNEEKS